MKWSALAFASACLCLSALPHVARADDLLESYDAYIGEDDLYNSNGERLSAPWQVIRQDRANVHKFGISQRGDESDSFFASKRNRDIAERLIRDGSIDRRSARRLMGGDVMIHVDIYGQGDVGDYIEVTVD
jgi:hypothetical protein